MMRRLADALRGWWRGGSLSWSPDPDVLANLRRAVPADRHALARRRLEQIEELLATIERDAERARAHAMVALAAIEDWIDPMTG